MPCFSIFVIWANCYLEELRRGGFMTKRLLDETRFGQISKKPHEFVLTRVARVLSLKAYKYLLKKYHTRVSTQIRQHF